MNGVRHHTWFSSALSSCYMVFARISEMEWLLSNSEIEFLYTWQNFFERLSKGSYTFFFSDDLKSLHWWLDFIIKIKFGVFYAFYLPRDKSRILILFFSLLDKLLVSCPNADSCQEQVQRGNLDDHLRYRCSGTLVACQFAASGGCDYRGPKKTMAKHQTECRFKKEGKT